MNDNVVQNSNSYRQIETFWKTFWHLRISCFSYIFRQIENSWMQCARANFQFIITSNWHTDIHLDLPAAQYIVLETASREARRIVVLTGLQLFVIVW